MATFEIKVDPASVKENKTHGYNAGMIHFAGKKTVTQTVVKMAAGQPGSWHITDKWVGSDYDAATGKLKHPIKVAEQWDMGYAQESVTTQVTQECHPIYALPVKVPRFTYAYLPTDVSCKACMHGFKHTQLKTKTTDWDYTDFGEYGPTTCDTVYPYCESSYCCILDYEKPTDLELEKMTTRGLNQVLIEDAD